MKFMRNGLFVLTLLSLCAEMLPRGGHGGGHSHGGGFRGGRGFHGGRSFRGGRGLGLGLAVGLGFGGWYYGGWNDWYGNWWNTPPAWYTGNDWATANKLDAISDQLARLQVEVRNGNQEAATQLGYLQQRYNALALQSKN